MICGSPQQSRVESKCKLVLFFRFIGDEMITNTNPTIVKLDPSVSGFYVRIKGTNARITISTQYDWSVTGYTFIFGDGDTTTFTILDSRKQIYETQISFSLRVCSQMFCERFRQAWTENLFSSSTEGTTLATAQLMQALDPVYLNDFWISWAGSTLWCFRCWTFSRWPWGAGEDESVWFQETALNAQKESDILELFSA